MNSRTLTGCLVACLGCGLSVTSAQTADTLAARVQHALVKQDPGWTLSLASEYRPEEPSSAPGYRSMFLQQWVRGREPLLIHCTEVNSIGEAIDGLAGQITTSSEAKPPTLPGIGDDAYLFVNKVGSANLYFRKGTVMGHVSGASESLVREVALVVLEQVPGKTDAAATALKPQ